MGWHLAFTWLEFAKRGTLALTLTVGLVWASSGTARAELTSSPNKKLLARAGQIAFEAKVPSLLFYSLIQAESNWRHLSESAAGAIGLTQLLPSTAEELKVNPHLIDENLRGGARYLRQMLDRFNDWPRALAAYNAGPAAVTSAGDVPDFAETKAYVPRVLKGMRDQRLLQHLQRITSGSCPSRVRLETGFRNLKVASIYWNYSQATSFALVYLTENCVALKVDDLSDSAISDTIEIPERSGWLLLSHVISTELYFDPVSSEVFAFSDAGAFALSQVIAASDDAEPDSPGVGTLIDYHASASLRQKRLRLAFGSVQFDARRASGARVLGRLRIGSEGKVTDLSMRAIHETASHRLKYGTVNAPDVPGRTTEVFLGAALLWGLEADDPDSYAPGPVGFSNVLPGVVRVYAGDRLIFEDDATLGPKNVELSEFPIESGELRYEFENILGEKFTKTFDYTRIAGLLPAGTSRTGLYVGLRDQNGMPQEVKAAGWLVGFGHEVGVREAMTLGFGGHLRSDVAALAVEGRGRLSENLSWSTGLSYRRTGFGRRITASGVGIWNRKFGVIDGLTGKFRWSSEASAGQPNAITTLSQVSAGLDLYGWDASLTARGVTQQSAGGDVEVVARAKRPLGPIGALSLQVVKGRDTRELEVGLARSWQFGGQYSVRLDLDWSSEESDRRELVRFARQLRLRRAARALDDWTASVQLRQGETALDGWETVSDSVAGSLRVPTGVGVFDAFARLDERGSGPRLTGRVGFRGRAALVEGKLSQGRASGLKSLFVDAGGVPDVPVYVNGAKVGVTNGQGVFLGDVLPSGVRSIISTEVDNVPLQFSIDDAETKRPVRPGAAGVYRVEFPFKKIVPLIIDLVDGEGAPLPGGFLVLGSEDSKAYVIRDGRTYLENAFDFESGMVVDGEGEEICEFQLGLAARGVETIPGEIVELGEVRCE